MTFERRRPWWLTGVAIIAQDGRVVALPFPHRHHHLFALAAFMGVDAEDWKQGFTNESGSFVSRRSTALRAGLEKDEAFSEDFW